MTDLLLDKVIVTIPGPPSSSDPAGMRWLEPETNSRNPGSQTVLGEVISQEAEGLRIRIGDLKHGGYEAVMTEGDGIYEFKRIGGIQHSELRTLKQALAPLLQESNASIKLAAEAIEALFNRGSRKSTVQSLVSIATDTKKTVNQRVQALTFLAVLLSQELER